jgi:hypothetical protein
VSLLGRVAVAVLLTACDASPPPPSPSPSPEPMIIATASKAKKTSASSRRKARARPPLLPWGIMDLITYERCKVGMTGTIDLKGAIGGRDSLSVAELDRPPLATKVPGEGRHSKGKAVSLAALFPEGARVRLTSCDGTATLVEPHEQWWLVKSTREFVKGLRTDTRAEILRDLTLAERVPDEAAP